MLLRSILSVMPKQQLVDFIDLVVSDTVKRFGEPSLRINGVEFGDLDEV